MRQLTVIEHLLLQQKKNPLATGNFTRLLNELILAAKIISRAVNKAGLIDVLGETGEINVQGENVQKLDEFANMVITSRLQRSGVLCAMASEENADLISVIEKYGKGKYFLVFDPLDGSSNIDANVNIGTIFSIYRVEDVEDTPVLSDLLQPGINQVAAGYFLYGSSTMLVLSTGKGVDGFTLDPSVGEFLLSHPNIKIPEKGKIYSVNEAYFNFWDESTQKLVSFFKDSTHKPNYSLRYIGSMVADVHRTLIYGGIFMYPKDKKDPKKPQGKLRLLYEANPMAFIVEQAGGMAVDGRQRILEVVPEDLHQRVPLFIGSPYEVNKVLEFYHQ